MKAKELQSKRPNVQSSARKADTEPTTAAHRGANLGDVAQTARLGPSALVPRDISHLQRTVGNRAVATILQPRADQFSTVMQQTGFVPSGPAANLPAVQRCPACEALAAESQNPGISTARGAPAPAQEKCPECKEKEERLQQKPAAPSSDLAIQRWPWSDAEGKESEDSSGSGIVDWVEKQAGTAVDSVAAAGSNVAEWAKEKGSAAVDAVTQGGADAVGWAKGAAEEYGTALLEKKRASLIAQINAAKQKLSGQDAMPLSANQAAAINNHLASLREKSHGSIVVPGIRTEGSGAGTQTGEQTVSAAAIETLLTNLQSAISAPKGTSNTSRPGASNSGAVQGSIQRYALDPATAAALAAAAAAATETTEAGAVPATAAAPETAGISFVVLAVIALVVAVVVGIIVYATIKSSEAPAKAEPKMPEGLSRAKKEKWKKCKEMHDSYDVTKDKIGSLGVEIKDIRTKYENGQSLTPKEKSELCAKVHQQLEFVERLINERRQYIDAGCDEFDWFDKKTTEQQRREAHEREVDHVKAQEGNLRGLLKKLQAEGIC